jgi:glycosyltransferase involved in cell wall biosynthesis
MKNPNQMSEDPYRMQRFRGIAFLGNYLPRNCGIATFTYDLSNAVSNQVGTDQEVIVAAMNDVPEGYAYPEIVKFELRQDHQIDYSRAADFLNFSHIDVVSLQHEYGIFGGEEGSNVLTFLRDLARPVVVTCHTVLKDPRPMQKELLCEIAAESEKLVVMSKLAVGFLEDAYATRLHTSPTVFTTCRSSTPTTTKTNSGWKDEKYCRPSACSVLKKALST